MAKAIGHLAVQCYRASLNLSQAALVALVSPAALASQEVLAACLATSASLKLFPIFQYFAMHCCDSL